VQKVVDTFGADAVLAYGNGTGFHALPGIESTPTTGLKRRLAQRLEVHTVPEYKTSCTCSYCLGHVKGDRNRNKLITDRRTGLPKRVPVRGIRRCNSVQCGGHKLWNRDHNAAINIRRNLLHKIQHGQWYPPFTRAATATATNQQQPNANGGATEQQQLAAVVHPVTGVTDVPESHSAE